MDDYISRQTAIDVAIKMFNAWYGHSLLRTNEIRARFEQQPSTEVQPVRHGRWTLQEDRTKKLFGWYICSECGAWIGEPTNYCSNCGADMRGEQNDG